MRVLQMAALCCALLWTPNFASAADFPLKDGDIWVMAGDSITAQHLHSNYFEAFCYARYPQLRFAFRNSGVGGHTIPTTLARFEYDIAAWNPTVVSVELGMNDQGRYSVDEYLNNMTQMVDRIRASGARPIMLTASPINDGSMMASLGRNQRLHDYAVALRRFSADQDVPFADQFHLLIDVWGMNKPAENLANSIPLMRAIAADDNLAGVEGLRTFLAAQDSAKVKPISLQGDPVHPGPPGQLTMAVALLKDLHAAGFVSHVSLDASGKLVEAKGCKVTNVKATESGLSFERLDECLPMPIPEEAAVVIPLYSTLFELSEYTLRVDGLKAGDYRVKVGGVAYPVAVSHTDLAKGVNLTALAYAGPAKPDAANPLIQQGTAILRAVAAKEGLVGQWRGLSAQAHAPGAAAELKQRLAEMTKQVQELDEKIREAARPQNLKFELAAE